MERLKYVAMATLTLQVSDELKAMAEARASEAGFKDLGEFVAQLIMDEAAGAPDRLTINSEDELNKLLQARATGPFVEMDAADFQQIREKLKACIGPIGNQP